MHVTHSTGLFGAGYLLDQMKNRLFPEETLKILLIDFERGHFRGLSLSTRTQNTMSLSLSLSMQKSKQYLL